MRVLLLYNAPTLPPHHPDYGQEAGVLDSVCAAERSLPPDFHVVRLGVSDPREALLALTAMSAKDAVLNFFEGFFGRGTGEATIAGLCELLNLSVTGSPSACLSLVRDKVAVKRLLLAAGLPTAPFLAFDCLDNVSTEEVARLLAMGPAIVKPACEDASLGVGAASVVSDLQSALNRLADVRREFGPTLIESFIAGREFNVAVVSLPTPTLLPLAEIVFGDGDPLRQLVTYEAKWHAGSRADLATAPQCPAQVDDQLADRLRSSALQAFAATGCRDYARIDFRVSALGEPFVLEVNANPDISPGAGFSRALAAAGIPYDYFLNQLCRQAAKRQLPPKKRDPRASQTASSVLIVDKPVRVRPLIESDVDPLLDVLRSCQMFRDDEVLVGEEVLRASLAPGQHDYCSLVAEQGGAAVGFSIHGLTSMTDATYDLYWIAVDPTLQKQGVARKLLAEVENRLVAKGARWLLAETSALPIYQPTRQFYLRCGFVQLSEIADFYRPGDGRAIYGKRLD